MKPIADAGDPPSIELTQKEVALVAQIAVEVRPLWMKSPRTALPTKSKSSSAAERSERYYAWIESLYVDAWRDRGKHNPR